jgi:hypothetical protein
MACPFVAPDAPPEEHATADDKNRSATTDQLTGDRVMPSTISGSDLARVTSIDY